MNSSRPSPFLVGEHRALDFLNTIAAPAGETIEWIANGADLIDWLRRTDLIDAAALKRFHADSDAADRVAEKARALREWLRGFVERRAGKPLRPYLLKELQPLNDLLARDNGHRQIEAVADGSPQSLRWRHERRWKTADELLQPIADAIGDLVCDGDFRYVRQCEGPGCTLMFYDRSKTHQRRWCSMAVCGNRAKAAAHRARRRSKSD